MPIYASGEDLLADTLSRTGADYPIPKALFDKFSDMLKYCFIVGGMPDFCPYRYLWLQKLNVLNKNDHISIFILQLTLRALANIA